jgi:hypothetical protein
VARGNERKICAKKTPKFHETQISTIPFKIRPTGYIFKHVEAKRYLFEIFGRNILYNGK